MAFTPQRTINNVNPHDFGSVLKFIQGVFNIREGAHGFADFRANGDLQGFFNFGMTPRPFQAIAAPLGASFLNDKRPPEPPDNDE